MFIERKINATTGQIELWTCQWENAMGAKARKVFLEKVSDEQPLKPEKDPASQQAICWAYGRTLGNIAVFAPSVLGVFPGKSGDDAVLPCDMVGAGKFRHGASRWWCRTHQTYWGTKADNESLAKSRIMQCANHGQPMNYVIDPQVVNVHEHKSIGIWCSLPAALSSFPIPDRRPNIHVHVREVEKGPKVVDRDFEAISLLYNNESLGLFSNNEITRVNVTPPAAFDFMLALEEGREMTCIPCGKCGFPHLDLGDFAKVPHKKHFCGNCGWDSTWSKGPIVSTPLKPLHDQVAKNSTFEIPKTSLDLDKYPEHRYWIWASTPALLWTADRPQQKGIHVHVNDAKGRVVDETFGEVILNGKSLDRAELLKAMVARTMV